MPRSLYRMYDKDDVLLYVGMSWSPPARFRHHANNSLWFSDVVKISIRRFASDSECKEAESYAIQDERPLHNKERPKPIARRGAYANP